MEITEVRIKLGDEFDNYGNERLLAFASITLDDAFVVRDLKVIEGAKGLFVSMPSRKLCDRCGDCGGKNHLRARYCNGCGARLDEHRALRGADGRAKLYADLAHPIHAAARGALQSAVLEAYEAERLASARPGYRPRFEDLDEPGYRPAAAAGRGGAA